MLTINQPQLTLEHIASIPEYRRKWKAIAIDSNSIDREQAKRAIYNAYSFSNLPQPNVVFFSNPKEAIQYINREIDNSWGKLENSTLIEYLNEVIDCSLDLDKWKVFYDLTTTCGWIFPYQKTALICDRYLSS